MIYVGIFHDLLMMMKLFTLQNAIQNIQNNELFFAKLFTKIR